MMGCPVNTTNEGKSLFVPVESLLSLETPRHQSRRRRADKINNLGVAVGQLRRAVEEVRVLAAGEHHIG